MHHLLRSINEARNVVATHTGAFPKQEELWQFQLARVNGQFKNYSSTLFYYFAGLIEDQKPLCYDTVYLSTDHYLEGLLWKIFLSVLLL